MLSALLYAAALAAASSPVSERRCGWLHNPTPANWWLVDKDGEWLIGEQGGYQIDDADELPERSKRDWVAMQPNGYGYGCACLDMAADRKTRRVTKIVSARAQPLRRCRADRRLPNPEE